MSHHRPNERLRLLVTLAVGAWAAFVVALEVVGAALPDWLSWTAAPATQEMSVSTLPDGRSGDCVAMPGGIEVCNDTMPRR